MVHAFFINSFLLLTKPSSIFINKIIEPPSVLLGTVFLLACAFFSLRRNNENQHPLYPPGPPGLPFIGNLLQLGTQPQKVFLKWSKQYGDVFSFKVGKLKTIVLNDGKIIKEVFGNGASAGRTTNRVLREISREHFGIVMNNGPTHEKQRRFTIKTIKDLGLAKKISLEGKILEEVRCMINYFSNRLNQRILGNRIFNGAVVNTLWNVVAGERTDWDKPDPPEIVNLAIGFTTSYNRTMDSGLMFAPFLRHLAPGYFGWTGLVQNIARSHEFMKRTIEKHIENLDIDNPKDFIDHYLLKINNTTDASSSFYKHFGERNLVSIIFELFIAGAETMSHTMSWFLAYLAYYPNIQRKLQAEIDNVLGQDRTPSLSDRIYLPYVEATMLEVLRITAGVTPVGVPHSMLEDAVISGYFFPKGCTVVSNIYQAHFDQNVWGDPKNFRPERFLSEDGSKVVRHDCLIPFSVGKRACPGEFLARDVLFLFLTNIFQNFEIMAASESNLEQVKNTEPTNKFLNEPEPFYITVSKRKVNA